MDDGTVEDGQSLLSVRSIDVSPDTITKLVMRIRALTFALLPVEVDTDSISVPSSRIITPDVIATYVDAAGDFQEALPYALLRARWMFFRDALHSAADYDENMGRAIACEVLARRIVHTTPGDKLMSVMSTRYRYCARDGDISSPSSALEIAIDQNCTIFLSSNEAQHVVNSLWKGDWVQVNNKDGDIDYVLYNQVREDSFWGRLDPSRLCVPRYQSHCRIAIWLFFLVVYSQAVRSPLQGKKERIDPNRVFDEWEGILYAMALAFSIEEMHKVYMAIRYFTWRALGFWTVISALTDSLLITAFIFRLMGIWVHDEVKTDKYHMLSFQFLSCVAPLIWMKLITVVEGYKYIGTMTICIARMLRESVVFFALLSVLLAGFVQAMYALDAADQEREEGAAIFQVLIEGLMQAPDFSKVKEGVFSYVLYSFWMLTSTVILLNVLISLFSSAYEEIVDDAEAQYMAFFASKTVGMIRAPDTFVYPAPFNVIEGFLISPFELCTSSRAYATINRVIMRILFFFPLMMIAVYESSRRETPRRFWHQWIRAMEGEDAEETSEFEDPQVEENQDDGLRISKVPFEDLVKRLPDTARSSEDTILTEIRKLQKQVAELQSRLDGRGEGRALVKTE